MTKSEEIVWWQGYDAGRVRNSDFFPDACRYRDRKLHEAYWSGFHRGVDVRHGKAEAPDITPEAGGLLMEE